MIVGFIDYQFPCFHIVSSGQVRSDFPGFNIFGFSNSQNFRFLGLDIIKSRQIFGLHIFLLLNFQISLLDYSQVMSSFPITCFQIRGPNFQISRFSFFYLKIILCFTIFGFINGQIFRFPYLEDSQDRSVQIRSDCPGFKFSVFSDYQNPIFVGLDIDFPVDRFSDDQIFWFQIFSFLC